MQVIGYRSDDEKSYDRSVRRYLVIVATKMREVVLGPKRELRFIPAETESLGKNATTRQSIAAEPTLSHLIFVSPIVLLLPALSDQAHSFSLHRLT